MYSKNSWFNVWNCYPSLPASKHKQTYSKTAEAEKKIVYYPLNNEYVSSLSRAFPCSFLLYKSVRAQIGMCNHAAWSQFLLSADRIVYKT